MEGREEHWGYEWEMKYKHLFEVYDGEETERSYYKKGQILRGIECSSGWSKPVEKYLETLEWLRHNRCYVDGKKISPEDNVIQIFQIKEKLGSVRAYASCPPHMKADVEHALGAFERECSLRCEVCGRLHENGVKATKSGWLRCACDECWNKMRKEE